MRAAVVAMVDLVGWRREAARGKRCYRLAPAAAVSKAAAHARGER